MLVQSLDYSVVPVDLGIVGGNALDYAVFLRVIFAYSALIPFSILVTLSGYFFLVGCRVNVLLQMRSIYAI